MILRIPSFAHMPSAHSAMFAGVHISISADSSTHNLRRLTIDDTPVLDLPIAILVFRQITTDHGLGREIGPVTCPVAPVGVPGSVAVALFVNGVVDSLVKLLIGEGTGVDSATANPSLHHRPAVVLPCLGSVVGLFSYFRR